MSNIKTGGPAFPVADPFCGAGPNSVAEAVRLRNGMSLRDYFAAKAMQGELAAQTPGEECNNLDALDILSYRIADAMLKARGEQE